MPTIYLKKSLYDRLVASHRDPSTFVNNLVEKALDEAPEEVPEIPTEKGKQQPKK
jgi:hypothetical protein